MTQEETDRYYWKYLQSFIGAGCVPYCPTTELLNWMTEVKFRIDPNYGRPQTEPIHMTDLVEIDLYFRDIETVKEETKRGQAYWRFQKSLYSLAAMGRRKGWKVRTYDQALALIFVLGYRRPMDHNDHIPHWPAHILDSNTRNVEDLLAKPDDYTYKYEYFTQVMTDHIKQRSQSHE